MLALLLLLSGPLPHQGWPIEAPLDRVLIVSVDGLRSDALLSGGPEALPALHRLLGGAATLNARTDPAITVTLPNHVGMFTGLPMAAEGGHGWRGNVDPPEGETLHQKAGRYLPGIFDVAHDHGLRTGLFAGKTKFSLFPFSWGAEHGRPDQVGADDGRNKIDAYLYHEQAEVLVEAAIKALGDGERALVALHFAAPDKAGHAHGWDLSPDSPYMQAVAAVDAQLGVLLQELDRLAEQGVRPGLILTADHGGGSPWKGHSRGTGLWVNYIIPFLVWSPCFDGGADLYQRFPDRWTDPGLLQPPAEGPRPVRNLDAGRVALELLDLPPLIPATAASEFLEKRH